jgi:hypothetical protein
MYCSWFISHYCCSRHSKASHVIQQLIVWFFFLFWTEYDFFLVHKYNTATKHTSQSCILEITVMSRKSLIFCELHNTSETLTTHAHSSLWIPHANPTPRSIFEDCAGKSSRLTKSPQASRCRREHGLPLKAQTPLNPEKFALTGSRTQDLRCYRGSCNH